jgi:benzoyl-CoA reductase/2-hydroxyglutaryl-CoA dehydratase subunit BcrC/BadD/HgdB
MYLGYISDHKDEIAPWGGLSKPTALVSAALDDPYVKITEIAAREYNVPLYVTEKSIHTTFPAQFWGERREIDAELESYRLDFMVRELEGLVAFLETVSGKTLSESKLRQAMEYNNQMLEYYWKATDLGCGTVPCPIGVADTMSSISSLVFFPGTEWGAEHAKVYYEEVKERADKGEAAVENEKVRIFFAGVPPWFSPGFSNAFEEKYGAIFVPQNYLSGAESGIRRDLRDPLRASASRHTNGGLLSWLPPTESEWFLYLAKKYKVHGFIFLMAESCKVLYTGRLFAMKALQEAGIPTTQLIADMNDARDWDDIKMKSLVSSFIETISG